MSGGLDKVIDSTQSSPPPNIVRLPPAAGQMHGRTFKQTVRLHHARPDQLETQEKVKLRMRQRFDGGIDYEPVEEEAKPEQPTVCKTRSVIQMETRMRSALMTALSITPETAEEIREIVKGIFHLEKSDNGVSNHVFFAKNREGNTNAVIKIFTKDSQARVQEIFNVTDALRAQGVPTPRVLGRFVNCTDKPVVIMEYITGSHIGLTPERLKEIGATMARLHTVDIGKPTLYEKSYTKEFFKDLFDGCAGWKELPMLREMYNKIDLSYLNELRRGQIHGDFSQTNVITDQDGKVHLIDFDHIHYDYLLTDLTRAQLFFAFDEKKLEVERIDNMVAGYETVNPLTDAEKRHFYKHLTLIIIWGLLDEHIQFKNGGLSEERFEANSFNRSTSIDYLLAKLPVIAAKAGLV